MSERMNGLPLALLSVGALAVASLASRRGSAATASRAPLFHATSFRAVDGIAQDGLVPARGGSTFQHGGYAAHSAGRVFLAEDPSAARTWFGKVADILEYNAGDDPELEDIVPVLLRIHGRWRAKAEVDPIGDRDVPGSVYVASEIPTEDIDYWKPGKGWTPVAEWNEDPEKGVRKWERSDGERHPVLQDAYDPGGFKPTSDTQFGREWALPKVKKKPLVLRVVWRGNADATVREVLTALDPKQVETWMKIWSPSPLFRRDGLPDENFLSIKAKQYGFKEGLEIVGFPRHVAWTRPPEWGPVGSPARASFAQSLSELDHASIVLPPVEGEWKHAVYGRPALTLLAHAHPVDAFRRLVAYAVEASKRGLVRLPIELPPAPPKRLWPELDARWAAERAKPLVFEPVQRSGMAPGINAYLGTGRYDRVEIGHIVLAQSYGLIPSCADDLAVLQRAHGRAPVVEVSASTIRYALLRGRGLGRKLYDALIAHLLTQHPEGFYLVPNRCGSGDTSPDADRVWAALRRSYPHHGLVVFVPSEPQ